MNREEPITLHRSWVIPRTLCKEAALNSFDFDWSTFDWSKILKRINKLQSRIVKAVIKGSRHLIRRLQHLLVNSFYAKLLSIKKVTENKGKNTSGIDGKLWKTGSDKIKAVLSLNSKKYKAQPLKRIFIEKKGKRKEQTKKRPLGIPTMQDRAMQALFALVLDPISEVTADQRSFGFRRQRSAQDAGQMIFNCLSGKNAAKWILEGDIKGCFDHIDHDWLLDNIPMNKRILKQFLHSGFVFEKELFPTHSGTPQGGIISPILANMTLDGIEDLLYQKYWKSKMGMINKQHNKHKVNFIRYADDFVVTADSREIAEETKEMIKVFLKVRDLELSEEKTKITHVEDGFDFLGWNVRKYKRKDRDKLIITPSKDSCLSIADKIRTEIKRYKTRTQDDLIKVLNPIIRGWCNYHRSMVSKKKYQDLDKVIFESLWKWARRRHPMKSMKWIKDRYWKREEPRDWIFTSESKKLVFASDTKIVRHRMIKLNMNPYLKENKEYFAIRMKYAKMRKS